MKYFKSEEEVEVAVETLLREVQVGRPQTVSQMHLIFKLMRETILSAGPSRHENS